MYSAVGIMKAADVMMLLCCSLVPAMLYRSRPSSTAFQSRVLRQHAQFEPTGPAWGSDAVPVHVAARSHASGSVSRCWCEEDAGN